MPDAESKGDFLVFRETLDELECLVDIQGSLLFGSYGTTVITEGIMHTLKLLTEFDVKTSESNAIEELERLLQIKGKVLNQCDYPMYVTISKDDVRPFDKIIESKIDFIKNGLISTGGIKPKAALERLAALQKKYSLSELQELLEFKRSAQRDTASSHKIATDSNQASETQDNPKRDLLTQMTTTKFVSSPLPWLQDQDSARTHDDDGSTIDGGELTPTSTIVSEFQDPNGG